MYPDSVSVMTRMFGNPGDTAIISGSHGTSPEWTTHLLTASITKTKLPSDSVAGGSMKLESNSTSFITHERPSNRTTRRISLLYSERWKWLKSEPGIDGDAPEARILTLARLVQEALKRFKCDVNLATPLSSLLREVSPSQLRYVNEPVCVERPAEDVKEDDIISRVADIKRDIEDQLWIKQTPSSTTWDLLSQDLEAFDGALVDLEWYISRMMDIRETIWRLVVPMCNSTCVLTIAELDRALKLIEQLEITYQYDPCDRQSCKIVRVIWETLSEKLRESGLDKARRSTTENANSLFWNHVDDTPPQGCIVTCVSPSIM